MSKRAAAGRVLKGLAVLAGAGLDLWMKQQAERNEDSAPLPARAATSSAIVMSSPTPAVVQGDSPRSAAQAARLPTAEEVKAVYLQARRIEQQGNVADGMPYYQMVAGLYPRLAELPPEAALPIAASLHRLAGHDAALGNVLAAQAQYDQAASAFERCAGYAEAKGQAERGRALRAEADEARGRSAALAALQDRSVGSAQSSVEEAEQARRHERQMEYLARLDAQQSSIVEDWARSLGRI